MRMRVMAWLVGVGLLGVMAGAAPSSSQETVGPVTVLRDVTLIDGLGGQPRRGITIVVRNGRIAELLDDSTRIPSGAIDLDVAGTYVIPGLIDAHVHLAITPRPPAVLTALMQATLLGGVTAVRDMGGNGVVVSELAKAAAAPAALSPAIFSAAVFAGPDAMWFTDARASYFAAERPLSDTPWLVRVDRRTGIREAVRRAKAFGATGVKIYSHLTRSAVDDIADEARRERMLVWSHSAPGPATPGEVVDARPATISHAADLVWQGHTGVPATLFGRPQGMTAAMDAVAPESEPIARLLRRMVERRVMLEPTLYVGMQAAALAADEDRPGLDRQVAYASAVTARAHKAGVGIVAGTDALGGASPNLHVELQLLVRRAGLSPVEAIRAATANAARAIGQADQMGSIRPGLRANLVVLEQDPSEDVRNTQTILLVMRDGVVHRRIIPLSAAPLGDAPARQTP